MLLHFFLYVFSNVGGRTFKILLVFEVTFGVLFICSLFYKTLVATRTW